MDDLKEEISLGFNILNEDWRNDMPTLKKAG